MTSNEVRPTSPRILYNSKQDGYRWDYKCDEVHSRKRCQSCQCSGRHLPIVIRLYTASQVDLFSQAFLVGTAIVTQSYFDTDIEGGLSVVKQGHLLNVPLYTVGNLALTTATARMSFRAGVAQKMKACK